MTAATDTDRRHQPLTQYVLSVASTLTVAVLLWIGNTASNTLTEMTRLSGVVTGMNRDIDRHDKAIIELQNELRRLPTLAPPP